MFTGSALPSAAPDGVTTTYTGPRRGKKEEDPFGGETAGDVTNPLEPGTPIGDAMWPLMVCALAYLIIRVGRKRAREVRVVNKRR